jgi:hypothetical protein
LRHSVCNSDKLLRASNAIRSSVRGEGGCNDYPRVSFHALCFYILTRFFDYTFVLSLVFWRHMFDEADGGY